MLTRATKNMLRGQAEFGMMTRAAMRIYRREQLEFLLDYVLEVLRKSLKEGFDITGKKIIDLAHQFDDPDDDTQITYFSIDPTEFGLLFTLVRDSDNDILSEDGVFAYVYNVDAPDCSELGYVLYQNVQGLVKRIG